MDYLCEAVDAFDELAPQHPDEQNEFYEAVHRIQDLLAVRVLRRLYPHGWPTFRDGARG